MSAGLPPALEHHPRRQPLTDPAQNAGSSRPPWQLPFFPTGVEEAPTGQLQWRRHGGATAASSRSPALAAGLVPVSRVFSKLRAGKRKEGRKKVEVWREAAISLRFHGAQLLAMHNRMR